MLGRSRIQNENLFTLGPILYLVWLLMRVDFGIIFNAYFALLVARVKRLSRAAILLLLLFHPPLLTNPCQVTWTRPCIALGLASVGWLATHSLIRVCIQQNKTASTLRSSHVS